MNGELAAILYVVKSKETVMENSSLKSSYTFHIMGGVLRTSLEDFLSGTSSSQQSVADWHTFNSRNIRAVPLKRAVRFIIGGICWVSSTRTTLDFWRPL